jgi:hypothetical protein
MIINPMRAAERIFIRYYYDSAACYIFSSINGC